MRRYRRDFVENWGWPPLFLNEKPFFPPISHKKSSSKIFWYCCRKRRTQSENQISPKVKQKTLQCFLFQNGGFRTLKSWPRKVREKRGKIKFHTKNRHSVLSSSTIFVSEDCSTTMFTFFHLWTNMFRLFRCIESFPYCSIHCKTGACKITCDGCRCPVPQVNLPADAGKNLRRYRLPAVSAGNWRKLTCACR